MKKIFESGLNGWGETAEKMYVYALESLEEYDKLNEMSHEEVCELFDVFDESGSFGVAPGSVFHTYEFQLTDNHIIMLETLAFNV